MYLLGISGKRAAGKDTLFNNLFKAPLRIQRVGFADAFKDVLNLMFRIPREQLYGDDTAKEAKVPAGTMTVRDACKLLGEVGNKIEPGIWTRLALDTAYSRPGCHMCVITDVRRPEEAQAIRSRGGKVIRLLRAPVPDSHETETAMDDYTGFDYIIDNRHRSAEWTYETAKIVLESWGWQC